MWIRTSVLQELCWRVLNEDVELLLPVGFTQELISSYRFRGFGVHFNRYSLQVQERCIRYFWKITKKYLDKLIKGLSEGKSPVTEIALEDKFVEDWTKVIDLLESRLEELPWDMEQERVTGNKKTVEPTCSKRFADYPIEMIQISENIKFVPSNGIVALRWIEFVVDRDPERLLPIAMSYEIRQTAIHFNIFKRYESEYESLLYFHLALKELYEREWNLISQEESLFGTQTELLELLELVGLFKKRLHEIQIEKDVRGWNPCPFHYRIGEPIFEDYSIFEVPPKKYETFRKK